MKPPIDAATAKRTLREAKAVWAVDTETTPVPFFDKKGKKTYSGHPKNAEPILVSVSDGTAAECYGAHQAIHIPPDAARQPPYSVQLDRDD